MVKMGLIDPKWKLSDSDSRAYDWASANQEHEDLRMAVYAAMIDSMDQNIGRLMASLHESGRLTTRWYCFSPTMAAVPRSLVAVHPKLFLDQKSFMPQSDLRGGGRRTRHFDVTKAGRMKAALPRHA